MPKYVVLDAGIPFTVVEDDEGKSIAAYTPGMLIDEMRQLANLQRDQDSEGVATMLEAAATTLEIVIKKHYGGDASLKVNAYRLG